MKYARIALVFLLISSAFAQRASFPSGEERVFSPDKKLWIRDSGGILTLETDHKKHRVLRYSRTVDVLWAPGSDYLAVNDWATSNTAEPLLISVANPDKPVNLYEKLRAELDKDGQAELLKNNDHVYFVAVRWVGPKTVLLNLFGHGDPKAPRGFSRFYRYTVGTGFSRQK
ncbi:MAG TPA: hypothetical protein VN577_21590 [Terriglobales bacterium]|nr:hypothetical protein [Terriglobales bacterium]